MFKIKNFGIFEISSSKILIKCIVRIKFLKRRNWITLIFGTKNSYTKKSSKTKLIANCHHVAKYSWCQNLKNPKKQGVASRAITVTNFNVVNLFNMFIERWSDCSELRPSYTEIHRICTYIHNGKTLLPQFLFFRWNRIWGYRYCI